MTSTSSSSGVSDTHPPSHHTKDQLEESKVQGACPVNKHSELQEHSEDVDKNEEVRGLDIDRKICRAKKRELRTMHFDIIGDKFWIEHPELLGIDRT